MGNEIENLQARMNGTLTSALEDAASIVTRSYLDDLESYDLMKPSIDDADIDVAECGSFYKLTKLVLNKEENSLHKLMTIVNVVSSIDSSLAAIIHSDGSRIEYYLGIISKNYRNAGELQVKRREAAAAAFKGAIEGNLVGSDVEKISESAVRTLHEAVFQKKTNAVSAISGIVALRDNEEKTTKGYVQGIENLVDSFKGQKYTILLIGDPVRSKEIQTVKQGYELLHTQLASLLKNTVTLNESDSISLAKARTDGVTNGITTGIAMTQSKSKTSGKFGSVNAGFGVNLGITGNVGFAAGTSSGISDSTGRTTSQSEINQRSQSVTDTISNGKISGKSLQLNYENRSVKALLDKIDRHLARLDMCESFGAFDCAAYVMADTREQALTIASNYNGLMKGEDSNVQSSHINTWHKKEDTEIINQYLNSFVHPRLVRKEDSERRIIVTPASIVSGKEMAIQIGLPRKSVNGISVVAMAPFGRNIADVEDGRALNLGSLYHMGHEEGDGGQKVAIDLESLTMHTFITGSTGAGKSTAIYSILDKLKEQTIKGQNDRKIKFMVIEPAKGEYKDRFGNEDGVYVYGTNDKKTPLLRINPFSFPADIHVLEHIDRLIEIFNVCWPMYAAMPAVLKDAVERAYLLAGWNLDTSECKYRDSKGNPLFPGFSDVLQQIQTVMKESQYSSESKSDYTGALCTRMKSLTNGLYGQIFTNDELPPEALFEENVIIDLSRTGSMETKSLIMGILVMKLQEHRMAASTGSNSPLHHVTVLEEAHNLLKRTSSEQSQESSNLLGKSVEMLANSIAEMRTYGEGFIIADQAPGLMDLSVIRNTNTKIILRLPDLSDRELVGRAASLNGDQIVELSRLKTFVAAVYQNNWLEPVLCSVDVRFIDREPYRYQCGSGKEWNCTRKKCLEYLLFPLNEKQKLDIKYMDELKDAIFKLSIPVDAKTAFEKYATAETKEEAQRLRSKAAYGLFNSELALQRAESFRNSMELWYQIMRETLEPAITAFSPENQKKIIAMIVRENTYLNETRESLELFENLMKHM